MNDYPWGIIPFGRHRGLTVIELAERFPKYARWMVDSSELKAKYPDIHMDLEARLEIIGLRRRFGIEL